MKAEKVEADVLCVGGGVAGLMAAIRASELGVKVVVAEKGNTLRSGAGGVGNDHFTCYIPESHGPDIKPVIEAIQQSQLGGRSIDFMHAWLQKSFDIVNLWDSWGIPMKYKGKYEFAGHAIPGRHIRSLKYAGQNQKKVLTEQAIKRGVQIINRVMVFELLGDSGVIGAIGISTREETVIEFQAKSVILGTGGCMRLYPAPTPSWIFNVASSPVNTGDGRAMAYRAGAELVNMEMSSRHAGPKYFARAGQGSWVGVVRDPQGRPVGPFVTEPDRRYGDVTAEIYQTVFEDYAKSGGGPIYMDCRGISDEDFGYMAYWLRHEGNVALLEHLKEEGINPKRNPIEFMTYEMTTRGGIWCNEKGETSIKGLYAAGDEFGVGVSSAATFGWIAGENAANHGKEAEPLNKGGGKTQVDEKKDVLEEIRSREVGPGWKETNIALQQIMWDYAGQVRSETLLNAGLAALQRLKQKARASIIAPNPHELMRCLEVFNLIDLAELVFITARERKETRGKHVRPDYPFTNPLMEKLLIVKRVNGKPVVEWREIQR